jgi:hypothetical protein
MRFRYVVPWLGLLCTGISQTLVDLRTQSKSVDFTAATSTKPFKTGTALPATCAIGEVFFKTNGAAGQNLYACSTVNSWTLQAGGTNLSGDVNGPMNTNVVTQIQGRAVSPAAPTGGQSLVWNASTYRWEVQNISGTVGPTGPPDQLGQWDQSESPALWVPRGVQVRRVRPGLRARLDRPERRALEGRPDRQDRLAHRASRARRVRQARPGPRVPLARLVHRG